MSYTTSNYFTHIPTDVENINQVVEDKLQTFTTSVMDKTADDDVLETFEDELETGDREGVYQRLCKCVNIETWKRNPEVTISWDSEEWHISSDAYFELLYHFLPLMKGDYVISHTTWNDTRDGGGGEFTFLTKDKKHYTPSEVTITLPTKN